MGPWIRTLAFRRYFERELAGGSTHSVLDAGCGDGSYAAEIARRLPHARIVGLDLLSSPKWAEHKLGNLSFRQADLQGLAESEAYDLVVSIDSLEHITNNRAIMRAFWNALRPGGLLYLAMPRDDHDQTFLPARWFAAHHEWAEHEHIGEQYELNELEVVLKEIGFSIRLARHTFTAWGRLSWELDNVLNGSRLAFRVRALGMPFFKLLGLLDLYLPIGRGHNLIIGEKAT